MVDNLFVRQKRREVLPSLRATRRPVSVRHLSSLTVIALAVTAVTALGCRELTGPAQAVEVRLPTDRAVVDQPLAYELHNRSADRVYAQGCPGFGGDHPRILPQVQRFENGSWFIPVRLACFPVRVALTPDTVVEGSTSLFHEPGTYRLAFRVWASADAPSQGAVQVVSRAFTVEER